MAGGMRTYERGELIRRCWGYRRRERKASQAYRNREMALTLREVQVARLEMALQLELNSLPELIGYALNIGDVVGNSNASAHAQLVRNREGLERVMASVSELERQVRDGTGIIAEIAAVKAAWEAYKAQDPAFRKAYWRAWHAVDDAIAAL